MSEILIIVVGLVVLGNSGLMLATDSASYLSIIEKYPIVKAALIVTFIGLFIVIPWQLGDVARSEVSAVPWEVWQEYQRHGNLNGVLAVVVNLIFLLWVFLLPGHLYANSVLTKTGERGIYPYISERTCRNNTLHTIKSSTQANRSVCRTRQMHSDGKKRRSFVALLFAAGDLER